MSDTPKTNAVKFTDSVGAWRSLKPLKKFLDLTVDEFEAELKPCFDARAKVTDFDNQLTGARNQRDEADVAGLDLVSRLVNAIKSDKTEGEDSELLETMGYVIKSKRKSGLHRSAKKSEAPDSKVA